VSRNAIVGEMIHGAVDAFLAGECGVGCHILGEQSYVVGKLLAMPRECNIISDVNIFVKDQTFHFGEVTYPPGGRCGPRIQANVQIVIIHSGEAHIGIDGPSYRVGPHEATVLLPGRRELILFSEKSRTRHTWCDALSPVLSGEARKLMERLPVALSWTARMEKIFRLGLETQRMSGRRLSPVIEHLGQALFHEFFAAAGVSLESGKPLHPAVEKALRFIESHLEMAISSKEIATSAGMSYQHLARLFRTELGDSPSRKLWRIRAERGAELLRSTGLSVGEIAAQLGFQNPFHFSRCIKKLFALAPVELRKAGRAKPSAFRGEQAHTPLG